MKTNFGVWSLLLLFVAALVGCNEQKPSDKLADQPPLAAESRPSDDVEHFAADSELKLSRESVRAREDAAKQAEEDVAAAEPAPPQPEEVDAEPRRRTVFDSLYEAVRNGIAEALDENAASP